MQEGLNETGMYFGYFFIRKCLWAKPRTIKETAGSLKKFYKCMCIHGLITEEEYDFFAFSVKESIPTWINDYEELYSNIDDDYDYYDSYEDDDLDSGVNYDIDSILDEIHNND